MTPPTDPLLDLVLPRLEGVRRHGKEWQARCPVPDGHKNGDRNPSMGVSRGDRQPVVFVCHTGCGQDDILRAIGLTWADISNPRPARSSGDDWLPCHGKQKPPPVEHRKVAEYRYRDATGQLIYTVTRCASKCFAQYRPDPTRRGGRSWNLQGIDPLPYRLPEILDAIAAGRTIYLVEGEKDADRLWREGHPATCNSGGASKSQDTCKWTDAHSQWLAGAKKIVVINDRDTPGRNHGRMAAASLRRAGCRLVLNLEPAYGKDTSDHLDAARPFPDGLVIPPAPEKAQESTLPLSPAAQTPPAGAETAHDWSDITGATETPPPPNPLRTAGHYQPRLDDDLPHPDDPTQPTDLPLLPPRFWAQRGELAHIRDVAHARRACADAVLYTTLARIAAMVPHQIRIDTGIDTSASLNLMVAIVGPSGTGKSRAINVARTTLQRNHGIVLADNLPLGSGEGLAEAYMGNLELEDDGDDGSHRGGRRKPRTIRMQDKHNAFFYLDEGESLFRLIRERQGSTLGPTLRTAWSGGTIGSQNATAERNRKVEDYCLGLVVGFQPHTAQPLLADTDAGTPQRFLWCPVVDPAIPPRRTDKTYPPVNCDWELLAQLPGLGLAETIKDALWEYDWLKSTGQQRPTAQESQQPLMLVKIAGLLAILAMRSEVNAEDWALALEIWDYSAAVRDQVSQIGKRQQEEDNRLVLDRKRQIAAAEEEGRLEVTDERTRRALDQVVKFAILHHEGITKKMAKNQLGRLRGLADEVLTEAVELGLLTTDSKGRWHAVRVSEQ